MKKITHTLRDHYQGTFETHGHSSQGVDWGGDQEKANLRYRKMLAVMDRSRNEPAQKLLPSVLDVGCGYGGLLLYARENEYDLDYTGIDVVESMIEWASNNIGDAHFNCADIFDIQDDEAYDFIICNGILTQKLDVNKKEMDVFANGIIRKMFELCRVGIAFNVMTTWVNFYANNLYYRDPAQMIAWCASELTPYFKIDHAYPLYEYTIYLYKNPV